MQDPEDADANGGAHRHRNYFSRVNFDDYWIALMAQIRYNDDADALVEGLTRHPLVDFQNLNAQALANLRVPVFTLNELIVDPVQTYTQFMRALGNALGNAVGQVPALQNMQHLDALFAVHKRAQRWIYNCIVNTLKVGVSMHYARQARFGAGLHLLNIIFNDNRKVTTRSLMALFSALLSLQMKSSEKFEEFARRITLLIQRLRNWRPPVILPDQLLLFCALRALPDVPFGPVRHIILASPQITFATGMAMLSDVANTGAELITSTLGSASSTSSTAKPTAVLCAPTSAACPPPAPSPGSKPQPRKPRNRAPRSPSEL